MVFYKIHHLHFHLQCILLPGPQGFAGLLDTLAPGRPSLAPSLRACVQVEAEGRLVQELTEKDPTFRKAPRVVGFACRGRASRPRIRGAAAEVNERRPCRLLRCNKNIGRSWSVWMKFRHPAVGRSNPGDGMSEWLGMVGNAISQWTTKSIRTLPKTNMEPDGMDLWKTIFLYNPGSMLIFPSVC